MRDRSRGYNAALWTKWTTHTSVIVLGTAATLVGLTIFGTTLYRNRISNQSNSFAASADTSSQPPQIDVADTSKVCFQTDNGLAPNAQQPDSGAGAATTPQALLELKPSELSANVITFGERSLVEEEQTIPQQADNRTQVIKTFRETKKQGNEHYAAGQYQAAINKFKAARDSYKNSPENLIFLNNALASQAGKSYTLAVTIPVKDGQPGADFNTAMAVLRGVAHAQDDTNKAGGIQGIPIKILIANDFDNSPQSAEAIAKILIKNQNVLGVIGHGESKATEAASNLYQGSQLASISPTSTSAIISRHSSAFRTVPNDLVSTEKLIEYVTSRNRQNIAIFYEEDSAIHATSYSQPVQEAFAAWSNNSLSKEKSVKAFQLSELTSNNSESLTTTLKQLIYSEKLDTIMLLPSRSDTSVLNALEVAITGREISDDILIIGNDAMYDSRIVECKDNINNMVAVSFWNTDLARTSLSSTTSNFARKASTPEHPDALWEAEINWQSAMAYDAVLSFSKALEQNHPFPSRSSTISSLANPRFAVDGATGIVKFDKNGNRLGSVGFVKVSPTIIDNTDNSQYDFKPVFF